MVRHVAVELTGDEALVLFEWLHRSEDRNELQTPSTGEQIALWALSCALESVLVEPFRSDYLGLVRDAEVRLTSGMDGGDPRRP